MFESSASDQLHLFLWIVAAAAVIGLARRRAERQRITREIEKLGGKVLAIESLPPAKGHHSLYAATVRTSDGRVVRAVCKSGLAYGVQWISDPPPSPERQDVVEIVEKTVCLSCQSEIDGGRTRCPRCGWTYLA